MSVLRNFKDLSKKTPIARSPSNDFDSRIYKFGPFSLIPREHLLLRNGKRVPLRPTSLKVLGVLLENHGCLVEKDRLMAEVWPESFVEEANLTNNIAALRKALEESPRTIRYIETVPAVGYRFVASVKEIERTKLTAIDSRACNEHETVQALRSSPLSSRIHDVVRDDGDVSTEANLSLVGGLRVVARKRANTMEVLLLVPRACGGKEHRSSPSSLAREGWRLQKDKMTISALTLVDMTCVKVAFEQNEGISTATGFDVRAESELVGEVGQEIGGI